MIIYGDEGIERLDALVVGAHPDDAEIFMGGTIALLAATGYRMGIVDLSRGETGSRGTPETRDGESRAAAEALGVSLRFNLEQPDGEIGNTRDGRYALMRLIRTYQPRFVFAHHPKDPHPDHTGAFMLTRAAAHNAGLGKMDPGLPPFRPSCLFTFCPVHRVEPSFLVDISEHFQSKMKAVLCHQSQVAPRREGEPDTYLGRPAFPDIIAAHGRSFGAMVGASYAEAFFSFSLLLTGDPLAAFGAKRGRLL